MNGGPSLLQQQQQDGMNLLRGLGHQQQSHHGHSAMDNVVRGDVEQFLASLRLDQYMPLFLENEIDWAAMALLKEEDFREIGLPESACHTILQALGIGRGGVAGGQPGHGGASFLIP